MLEADPVAIDKDPWLQVLQLCDHTRLQSSVSGLDGAASKSYTLNFSTVAFVALHAAMPPTQVAQLAGYVSEHSAYHHGEASLQSTIVGMAQDFVGSNNLNLLYPSGQFGTRLQGGKDAASARQGAWTRIMICEVGLSPVCFLATVLQLLFMLGEKCLLLLLHFGVPPLHG